MQIQLKRIALVLALFCGSLFGQTSNVTATITDSDGQTWNNGSYTINFQTTFGVPGPYTWNGGQPFVTQFKGVLNGSGVLSISLPDNNFIAPAGSQWQFTICPNAYSQCSNITLKVTGNPNLSSQLSAGVAVPRFGPGANSYGYLDVEVGTPAAPLFPGAFYYNVTNNVRREWNGQQWNNASGGGGGGGTPGGLNTQIQLNNSGVLGGATAQNGTTQATYNNTTGQFNIPNLESVRWVDASYKWSQSPAADLTSAGSKTVTLTPCPLGIDTSNNANAPYKVYVSTTGTPEVVAVTGGSCTPGLSTGNISFTTVNTHANGYTVSSASDGIQEAINDACGGTAPGGNCQVQLAPASSGNPNYVIRATVYLHGNPGGYKSNLIGQGAYINCATRDVCIYNSTRGGVKSVYNVIQGLRFKTDLAVDGAQITGVSASTGLYTVTAAGHPFVTGDYATIDYFAPNGSQHTIKQVTVTDSSHFTYSLGSATFSNTAPTWGWAAIENAAIEDDAQGSVMRDIDFGGNIGSNNGFSYGIVVDNDQNANIEHLTFSAGTLKCTSNFCGTLIYSRGDSGNSGIVHLSDSDLSLNCQGNGVLGQAGNSMSIKDVVIQGFTQYGVRYDGGLQGIILSNVYEEVGSCTNPQYPGSLQAMAGAMGTQFTIQGDAPIVGFNPLFANTGANQRNYFIVPKSTGFGNGPILYAGSATTNGAGTVNVYWPQVANDNAGGTITYDVLLTTGASAVSPYLGSANSLTTAISGSCANGICTFADTHAATSAYTVALQNWFPHLSFWPGSYVGTDGTNFSSSVGVNLQFNLDRLSTTVLSGFATSVGNRVPSATVRLCVPTQATWSPAWIVCQNAPTSSSAGQATVLQQIGGSGAGPTVNVKGRLNFGPELPNLPGHLVTLRDSNISKTLATVNHRPLNDANDSFIGVDTTGGISIGAQNSLSRYLANVGDNTNWVERITSAGDTVKVPFTVNDGGTAFNIRTMFGACSAPGDSSHDVICADPAGDLAFNKQNEAIFEKVIPQSYTVAGLPAANTVATKQLAIVTDAATSACPVTVGGGGIRILVRSNGTTWDCVSGGGGTAISVSLFSALPGSPVNNQLAVVTDWTGTCPVTSGSGSTLHERLVIWNAGTSKWDCVPDGFLPYVTTVQAWDGNGAGGLHFIQASTDTNTSDQLSLTVNSLGTLLRFADASGPPGALWHLGMWPSSSGVPIGSNKKCIDVDSSSHLNFFTQDCFSNPMTTPEDIIKGGSAGAPVRLPIGTNGQVLGVSGGALAYISALTNPLTTTGDIIQSNPNSTLTRLGIGTSGQVLTVVGGLAAWATPSVGGTVNNGTACNPAYYATTGTAVSGFAQVCFGDGSATAWVKINPTTASQDIFNVSLNSTNKFWVDSTGVIHVSGNVQASSNTIYNGNATSSNVDYSASTDSNSNQTGAATYRNGDVTGNSSSTAGSTTVRGGNVSGTGTTAAAGDATVQPGGLTNAAPGASATEGKLHVLNAYLKGGTTTTGNLGCVVSSNTVGDCTLGNNPFAVGIIQGTVGGTVYVQVAGRITVNLDASTTYSANDRFCVSTTGAAQAVRATSGTAGCPSASKEVGYAASGGTTTTTVDLDLKFSGAFASDGVTLAGSQALTNKDLSGAGNTFPTFNQNTSGTAANLSGTPALPNGTTGTTQSAWDGTTKLATDIYAETLVKPIFSTAATGLSMATAGTNTVITGPTTMVTPAANGTYRLVFQLIETTAGSGGTCNAGTVGISIGFKDADTAVSYAIGVLNLYPALALNTATVATSFTMNSAAPGLANNFTTAPREFRAASGTAIQYQVFEIINSNCTTAPVFAVRPALYYMGY